MSGGPGGAPTVQVVRDGRVWRLALRRPEAGNALDQQLADAFAEAVALVLGEEDPQIVLLCSEGARFCVGGDVRAIATAADPGGYLVRLASTLHDSLEALRSSPHLVVAAVQGAAAGAGFAFVLNADLVVASERAVFLSAYAGVGLSPDCGLSRLLPMAVGARRAIELTLTGRALSAAEALDWGVVTAVVPPEELDAATDSLLERLAAGPAHAQARTVALIRRGESDYRAHLDAEVEGLAAQIALPDTVDRMLRFLDRGKERGGA